MDKKQPPKKTPAIKKDIQPTTLAVIDIGTTAIRMTIAQTDDRQIIKPLESLQHGLSLGKDTFTKGYIARESIEDCVKALKMFKKKLLEYQITDSEQIRVVATTAVREASNHQTFVDRIFIATGLTIDIIDDIDVVRLTYLSAAAHFASHSIQRNPDVLITEMSGGTTELILLHDEDVLMSKSYRLGALRLREMIDEFRTPVSRQRSLIENDTYRTVYHICQDICPTQPLTLVALGGDIRFAATHLQTNWDSISPVVISISSLSKLAEQILSMSVDEIVSKFHISYSDAETVGPTLLFYVHLAHAINENSIIVASISMRSGILMEMAKKGVWTKRFTNQIINSALAIGNRFHYDQNHARHVESLAVTLFEQLKDEHRIEPWYELHLRVAAILHDIGSFINIRSHHKHSMYLIENSELFGLSKNDLHIIALTARYHRRSSPKPEHIEYMSLDNASRLTVLKLAAILRIADALDRSHSQRIKIVSCLRSDNSCVITLADVDDITLEQLSIMNKGILFEEVYGMRVVLQKKGALLE